VRLPGAIQRTSLSIMKNLVTVKAFAACAASKACSEAGRDRDEPKERCNWKHERDSHPINCVTWAEAVQFCAWVSARLPTSAEWEYAATSGVVGRRYPWGDAPVDGSKANYCDVNCPSSLGVDGKNLVLWDQRGWIDRSQNDGFSATAPVGSYPRGATLWGLLDMAGNVWQWTSTEFGGPGLREVRGGSWDNPPVSLETTHRLGWPPDGADSGMGFRCARN
jgi:formylglycine-generating enzyme required for sulfatase activity